MSSWSEFLQTQTVQPVLSDANALCGLDHLGIIQVSGADARSFLQGQFSSDIQQLEADQTQLSGYCNPKGRMLAIMRIVPTQDDLLLVLPKTLLPEIQKRLQLYILRSDVRLQDVSNTHAILELAGSRVADVMPAVPETDNAQIQIDERHSLRLPGDRPRYQIIGPVAAVQKIWQKAIQKDLTPTDARAWRLLDIRAGLPMLYTATSEAFVPQMTNLHLLGGVSFQKGCYTGQEVVARMHYLGKQKRRMYRVHIAPGSLIEVGQALYAANAREQTVGTVLEIAPLDTTEGYEALVVCQINSMEQAALTLQADSQPGPAITCLNLPYAYPVD